MYSWLFCSLFCFWIIRCWCWDQLWSILWFCNLCFVFVLFSAADTSWLCTEARMRSRDNTEWGCFERAQRPLCPSPYTSLDSQDDYFMFVHICLCCNKGLGSPKMCHYDVFWHFWSKAFHYCCVSVLFWSIVLKNVYTVHASSNATAIGGYRSTLWGNVAALASGCPLKCLFVFVLVLTVFSLITIMFFFYHRPLSITVYQNGHFFSDDPDKARALDKPPLGWKAFNSDYQFILFF